MHPQPRTRLLQRHADGIFVDIVACKRSLQHVQLLLATQQQQARWNAGKACGRQGDAQRPLVRARAARGIQSAIDSISPYKSVTVQINTIAGRISDGSGNMVNPGLRAGGGPVTAGRPYIVGEQRPELFVPNRSGRIVPRVDVDAGGGLTAQDRALLLAVAGRPVSVQVDGREVAYAANGHNDWAVN